jgi:hypothetical protein
MNNLIQETKEIIQLPESDVIWLLVNFKWDKMFLLDSWINNTESFLLHLSTSSNLNPLTSYDHQKLEDSDQNQVTGKLDEKLLHQHLVFTSFIENRTMIR